MLLKRNGLSRWGRLDVYNRFTIGRGAGMKLGVALVVAAGLITPAAAGEVDKANWVTGVIDAYGGGLYQSFDNPGWNTPISDASAFLLGVDGYFNGWIDGNSAVQFDLNAWAAGPLQYWSDYAPYVGSLNAATHLAYRDPDQYAAGAFGAMQQSFEGTTFDDKSTINYSIFGIEGQYYTDNLTFYGQAGLALGPGLTGQVNASERRDYGDFGFVRAELRYFPTDNIRLAASALYGEGDTGYYQFNFGGAQVPTKLAALRLSADYRPDDQNFSVFAAYSAGLNWQSISNVTRSALSQRIEVGMRFDIGADNLKTRDRQGVTWDVPDIAGLVGQSNGIDFCFDPDCWPNNVPLP